MNHNSQAKPCLITTLPIIANRLNFLENFDMIHIIILTTPAKENVCAQLETAVGMQVAK